MYVDRRLAGKTIYHLHRREDWWMLVPRQLLNSVVFLGIERAAGHEFGGTAYFVSVPTTLFQEKLHVYLVTAHHCIRGQHGLVARLNAPAGGTRIVGLPDGDSDLWLRHPEPAQREDYVDLTATRMPLADVHEAYAAER